MSCEKERQDRVVTLSRTFEQKSNDAFLDVGLSNGKLVSAGFAIASALCEVAIAIHTKEKA
jgi:hypothetical protein